MAESALRQVLPSSLDRIRSQEGQMLPAPAMQQQSLRGAAFNTMYDMFGGSSEDPARRAQATRRAEGLLGAGRFAADMTPVVGDALAFGEARDAYRQGNMGQAAILGGLATLGMVPVVGDAAAKAAKNLVKTDYRGSHQAPARDSGAPLNDLTMLIPEDVYSAAGPRLYGIGDPEVDRQAFSALRNVRGKPEAEVTVYRAVPENVSSINEGDWVTTSRKYADMHGERSLGGNYKIIEQKAKAKDLFSEGYPYEFGYSPLDMSNRARMQRAAEQGFDVDNILYHGTGDDFSEFDPLKMGKTDDGWFGKGFYFSPIPDIANQYVAGRSPNVKQVYLRAKNPYDWRKNEGAGMRLGTAEERYAKTKEILEKGYDAVDVYSDRIKIGQDESLPDNVFLAIAQRAQSLGDPVMPRAMIEQALKSGMDYYDFARHYGNDIASMMPSERTLLEKVVFDPANIRSVNAAFDPANRRSANILAGGAGAAVGLSALRQFFPQEEERPID